MHKLLNLSVFSNYASIFCCRMFSLRRCWSVPSMLSPLPTTDHSLQTLKLLLWLMNWSEPYTQLVIFSNHPTIISCIFQGQAWTLAQFYLFGFLQSRISVTKYAFCKLAFKVCVSCFPYCPEPSMLSAAYLTASLYL